MVSPSWVAVVPFPVTKDREGVARALAVHACRSPCSVPVTVTKDREGGARALAVHAARAVGGCVIIVWHII